MSFSQISQSIVAGSTNLLDSAVSNLRNLDPQTQHVVLISIGILVLTAICLGIGSFFEKKEEPAASVEGTDVLSGSIAILLRDLSTKLTNQATQAREDLAFLKQEIQDIRALLSSNGSDPVQGISEELAKMHEMFRNSPQVEDHLARLEARIASYSALMREEFGTLREEIVNPKKGSNGTAHIVGSHVVDATEFFKQ